METLEKLIEGFEKFKQRYYIDEPSLYEELIDRGQTPKTLVIACCDSRVHPAQVLSTSPGEIFVARNVANLVPPFENDGKSHGTSAAIEFGVKHLKVRHIIVFGHGQCGGIKSLMAGGVGSEEGSFIDPWMSTAMPTREKILENHSNKTFEDQCRICEQAVIEVSVKNLLSFPWINSRVEAGELEIHGWYFEIEKGILLELNQEDGTFSSIHSS
jgi:carbonic anhydrase